MLRVLLKAKTEHLGVAAKLVASASDLDAMAAGERDLDMLRGWRAEVFGDEAKRLCQGEIGLVARDALSQPLNFPSDQGRIDRLFVSPIITILRMPSSVPVDRNLPAVS